ncbi:nitroreductase family protein [Aureimonas psammosilenae]|uniref:nitroreductase family protein n=1 Tax=Aureimonas psammosilenae TaxID=2495496 RepID=UPI001260D93A|nr:nitroreductase [Aureimonas psammosilenae]
MTEIADYLATRRSIAIPALEQPAPEGDMLQRLVTIAARVPDHGKLAPWRFILYRGQTAAELGNALRQLVEAREGPLGEARAAMEEARLSRSPLVIGVVSRAKPHVKIPEWEQVLSAGAAAMNLVHAAHSLGFGANWVTEWIAYDDEAKAILGIQPDEKVVGFIHVGTYRGGPPADRVRPELADILTEATVPNA